MVDYQLCKYHHSWQQPHFTGDRERILVIDQTLGDSALQQNQIGAERFHLMVNTALADYPDAEIVVKVHPDVLAGKRQGHFTDLELPNRVRLYAENVNPLALCQEVSAVYTVNSGFGFEALLAGCSVVTFGWPWYAGWGLTTDRYPGPRRGQQRSLSELFAAAYPIIPAISTRSAKRHVISPLLLVVLLIMSRCCDVIAAAFKRLVFPPGNDPMSNASY